MPDWPPDDFDWAWGKNARPFLSTRGGISLSLACLISIRRNRELENSESRVSSFSTLPPASSSRKSGIVQRFNATIDCACMHAGQLGGLQSPIGQLQVKRLLTNTDIGSCYDMVHPQPCSFPGGRLSRVKSSVFKIASSFSSTVLMSGRCIGLAAQHWTKSSFNEGGRLGLRGGR